MPPSHLRIGQQGAVISVHVPAAYGVATHGSALEPLDFPSWEGSIESVARCLMRCFQAGMPGTKRQLRAHASVVSVASSGDEVVPPCRPGPRVSACGIVQRGSLRPSMAFGACPESPWHELSPLAQRLLASGFSMSIRMLSGSEPDASCNLS
jgi:hypothetical protein